MTTDTQLAAATKLVLTLEYPASWPRPRNPLAPWAATYTETFLREAGILPDDEVERKLARMDVAGYGGWPFGLADLHTLQTVTAFLSLWILYDDLLEGDCEPQPETVVRAVRGDGVRPEHLYYGAWWDLGKRCRAQLSCQALERHGERFRAWLRSLEHEAELVRRERAGDPCSFSEYLAWRKVNVGVLPTLDFLEIDLGEELLAAAWQDPRLSLVESLAAEIVALQNDLFGYAKDCRAGWPNAVRQLQAESGLEAVAALTKVVELHNQRVAELERQGRALARDSGSLLLAAWWQRLSTLVAGFASWHSEAARYGAALELEGFSVELTVADRCETTAVLLLSAGAASGSEFFA